jgi:hypothetical protein
MTRWAILGAAFAVQYLMLQLRDRAGMRRFGLRYRDLPRFVLRRIDRMAGEVNAFLVVVAISLLMLDILYAAQKFVAALPPAVHAGAQMP